MSEAGATRGVTPSVRPARGLRTTARLPVRAAETCGPARMRYEGPPAFIYDVLGFKEHPPVLIYPPCRIVDAPIRLSYAPIRLCYPLVGLCYLPVGLSYLSIEQFYLLVELFYPPVRLCYRPVGLS